MTSINKVTSSTRFIILCYYLVVITSGCVSQKNQLVISTQPPAASTLSQPDQIIQHTPTPSQTIAPSQTPTKTAAPISTLTASPTVIATMSPAAAMTFVVDLLQNNKGCRLPCWWGIAPGISSWQNTRDFLARFALDISVSGSPTQTQIAYTKFLVPEDVFGTALRIDFTIISGTIQTISGYTGNVPNYQLPQFLSAYGQPEEAWIRTYANASSEDGRLPFDITLFYPHQGIMASYASYAERIGDHVRICPQKTNGTILGLWSPDNLMGFDEATTAFELDPEAWPFKRLNEVTGFDETTFYQTFMKENNSTCLETPEKQWLPLP